jgi:hypothetical protein
MLRVGDGARQDKGGDRSDRPGDHPDEGPWLDSARRRSMFGSGVPDGTEPRLAVLAGQPHHRRKEGSGVHGPKHAVRSRP